MGFGKKLIRGTAAVMSGGLSELARGGGGGGQGGYTGGDIDKFYRQRTEVLNNLLAQNPEYISELSSPEAQQMKKYAFGTDQSEQFKKAQELLALQQQQALEDQATAAGGQQANAYSQLAMGGGLSSGARERVAAGLGDQNLLASQGIRRQGQTGLLDLSKTEEAQRAQRQGEILSAQQKDIAGKNAANQAAYQNKLQGQMALEAAKSQEMAQSTYGAQSGGGGCCFIFLEARYGNGTMDAVVRRFRDEHMTDTNKRGYYKLSEVLVPLMRVSKVAKKLVRLLMTDPLVAYGKWHYNKTGLGWVFAPVKNFWLKTFHYLGGEHKFIRENGETV